MLPIKVCYADPPYIGQAKRHYGQFGGSEVDHNELITNLIRDYPDGWALSLSSPTLRQILKMIPDEVDVRVMAWVKPFASFKPGVNPAYAWEPVIVCGGRQLGRDVPTVRDWVSANITLQRGMPGAKPDDFCYWLFEVLGLRAGDEFVDMFPGSGAVTRCWHQYQRMMRLTNGVTQASQLTMLGKES
jgi:hypothetical protein